MGDAFSNESDDDGSAGLCLNNPIGAHQRRG
jgi:hypothetical protein